MEEGFATLRSDPQELAQAKAFWYKPRLCAFCGQKFTLMRDFGTWGCSYHSGFPEYVYSERADKYIRRFNCCGEIVPTIAQGTAIQEVISDYYGTQHTTPMCMPTRHKTRLNNSRVLPKQKNMLPTGCIKADCRERAVQWTPDDVANIQNFAGLLPFMPDIEMREAFQNATPEAMVFRDKKSFEKWKTSLPPT
jgi:hypothetical protein